MYTKQLKQFAAITGSNLGPTRLLILIGRMQYLKWVFKMSAFHYSFKSHNNGDILILSVVVSSVYDIAWLSSC